MPAALAGSLTTTLAATAAQARASRSMPSRSSAPAATSTLTGPPATSQISRSRSWGARPAARAASASSAALVVTPLVSFAATQATISPGSTLST